MQADDPNRCQTTIPGGQCPNPALEGHEVCATHVRSGKDRELQHYLITNKLLGTAARRHAGVAEIKSLRDEIALTRAMVEVLYNSIESQAELVAAMPRIHANILAIEKLVNTCHQMEVRLGDLLDKAALLTLAQRLIEIIDSNLKGVPDHDLIVENVATQMLEAISNQENKNA